VGPEGWRRVLLLCALIVLRQASSGHYGVQALPAAASRSACQAQGSRRSSSWVLVLPDDVARWSLFTLREKLVKIGARIVRHGRYVVFQLAEVAVLRALFATILRRIDRLRGSPVAAA
jgi:hypothetical protein